MPESMFIQFRILSLEGVYCLTYTKQQDLKITGTSNGGGVIQQEMNASPMLIYPTRGPLYILQKQVTSRSNMRLASNL